MKNNSGFINLNNPTDLYKKLIWEYDLFTTSPESSYYAFNFFVTAFHLADWIYKGETRNNPEYSNFIKDNLEIFLAGQIANGAKHFELKDKKYTGDNSGIKNIHKGNLYVQAGYVQDGYLKNKLIITLDNQAKDTLGNTIEVIDLAERVINFYKIIFETDE